MAIPLATPAAPGAALRGPLLLRRAPGRFAGRLTLRALLCLARALAGTLRGCFARGLPGGLLRALAGGGFGCGGGGGGGCGAPARPRGGPPPGPGGARVAR